MSIYNPKATLHARRASRYAAHVDPSTTPQSEPVDERQQKNNAGGYTFVVDEWTRLARFLILGSEGGTYYASERKLTLDNVASLRTCLDKDGPRAVEMIRSISSAGRAPKNDPAIFALAVAASHKNDETRKHALAALNDVCRIGTHLFQFFDAVNVMRGGGRGLRRAIARWYDKPVDDLAYQLVKYQQRNGVSHRDVLRMLGGELHLDPQRQAVLRWAFDIGFDARTIDRKGAVKSYDAVAAELPRVAEGVNRARAATTAREVAKIADEFHLTHEMVNNEWKNSPEVWAALLKHMPPHAVVRELGRLTRLGVVAPLSDGTATVLKKLGKVALAKARMHPISLLKTLAVYKTGRPMTRKDAEGWTPVPAISAALEAAFYDAFVTVEPTGKRMLLALDISGSMDGGSIAGSPLTPREGAGAMAMVIARTEPQHHFVGFTAGPSRSMHASLGSGLTQLNITARDRLDHVVGKMRALPMGGTDCALPMVWATANKVPVDVFVVITDNETWAGNVHPHIALQKYRDVMSINAKLVVMGMTATQFTIANPSDAGMLDCVGFDTQVPQILNSFARGEF